MNRTVVSAIIGAAALAAAAAAQQARVPSPRGSAATEIGGKYVAGARGTQVYQGGKWIEITYGRPIKRGRDLWGSGATYGQALLAGAPIWRAGADVSTRLKTEVPLVIGTTTVQPGEYSLFIDLKPNSWTFVVSTWAAQEKYDPKNKDALWGAYGYTPAKDVVRAPMTLSTLPHSFDQLTWSFVDMTPGAGALALVWDRQMATVGFRVP